MFPEKNRLIYISSFSSKISSSELYLLCSIYDLFHGIFRVGVVGSNPKEALNNKCLFGTKISIRCMNVELHV